MLEKIKQRIAEEADKATLGVARWHVRHPLLTIVLFIVALQLVLTLTIR